MIPEATALLVLVLLVTGTGLVVWAVLWVVLRALDRQDATPTPGAAPAHAGFPAPCPDMHQAWHVIDVHLDEGGQTHVTWACDSCLTTGVTVA